MKLPHPDLCCPCSKPQPQPTLGSTEWQEQRRSVRWSQGPTPTPLAPVSQARESRPQPYSAPQLAGQKHGFSLGKGAWTGLDAQGTPDGKVDPGSSVGRSLSFPLKSC